MEQIKKFLHGKGFALVLAACLLAAAAAGVWAVRTVRDELRQNLTDLTHPSSTGALHKITTRNLRHWFFLLIFV